MSEYPVHETVKVVKAKDIYRTDKWIKAVLKTESFGKNQVCCYQWLKGRDGKWKRKQKMCAKNKEELDQIYSAMLEFLGE